MEVSAKIVSPSVSDIFGSMSYGPAPESDKVAQAWLEDHGRCFGHFIDNKWVRPDGERKTVDSVSPADGKVMASTLQGNGDDVNMAVEAAKKAYPGWSGLSGHDRARHIYSLARHVQKHARLISVVEAMDNGKSIRETRLNYTHNAWLNLLSTLLT